MDAASPAADVLLCLGARLCQYKYDSIVMAFPSIFDANLTWLGSTIYIHLYIDCAGSI